MRSYLLAVLLAFSSVCFAQIDSLQLDSLQRQINESTKELKAMEERNAAQQESLYQRQVQKDIERMNQNTVNFVRERDAEEKRKAYRHIAIGVAFLAILIVGLLRRRKKPGGPA